MNWNTSNCSIDGTSSDTLSGTSDNYGEIEMETIHFVPEHQQQNTSLVENSSCEDVGTVSVTAPTNRLSSLSDQRRQVLHFEQEQAFRLEQEQLERLLSDNYKKTTTTKKIINGIGNAINAINIGKWIDQLEHDQEIADQLEKYNKELLDEQERKRIVHEAHMACYNAIRKHLHSFLAEHNMVLSNSSKHRSSSNDTEDRLLYGNNKYENGSSSSSSSSSNTNVLKQQQQTTPIIQYEDWILDLHPDSLIPVPKKLQQQQQQLSILDGTNRFTSDTSAGTGSETAQQQERTNGTTMMIDPRYYLHDSDHRILWNETITSIQQQQQQQIGSDHHTVTLALKLPQLVEARSMYL